MSSESSNAESQSLLAQNIGALIFSFIAFVIFLAVYLGYELYFSETKMFNQYLELCASLASQLLTVGGVEHTLDIIKTTTEAELKTYFTNKDLGAEFVVKKGSDGFVVFALLIASIGAWPGKWIKKLGVLTFGLALMFFLNIVRIAGMFLVDMYAPLSFEFYNDWVFSGGLILIVLLYFLWWIKLSGAHPNDLKI